MKVLVFGAGVAVGAAAGAWFAWWLLATETKLPGVA